MIRFPLRVFRQITQLKVFYSVNTETDEHKKFLTLARKLETEFSDISPIIPILKTNKLNDIHFDEWKSRISLLKTLFLSEYECFKMISHYPYILKIPYEKFEKSALQWFNANLGLKNLKYLFSYQPYMLDVGESDISKRLPHLRALFRTSEALVILLINSPEVMFDDWNSVNDKINYLKKVKGYKMGEISESKALSKSLNFIQFRFDLLEKCGIYKQKSLLAHKENKYDKSSHQNPLLKEILASKTHTFLEIAKISLEEYAVYKDLFNARVNENINDDDEDNDNNYRKC